METINKMAATSKAIDLAETNSKARGTDTVKAPSELAVKFNEQFASLKPLLPIIKNSSTSPSTAPKGKRILLIDNYDSFTYNIYQYLSQLGCEVIVLRNNVTLEECDKVQADSVVLSPGPGWPKDAGKKFRRIRLRWRSMKLNQIIDASLLRHLYGCCKAFCRKVARAR